MYRYPASLRFVLDEILLREKRVCLQRERLHDFFRHLKIVAIGPFESTAAVLTVLAGIPLYLLW